MGKAALRLQVCSDLHVDSHTAKLRLGGDCDLVIVAGDFANGNHLRKNGFSGVDLPVEKPALYVFGNHDFYRADFTRDREELKRRAQNAGFTVLDRQKFEFRGWTFLGCTLWTDFGLLGPENTVRCMTEAFDQMRDFGLVRVAGRPLAPFLVHDFYNRDRAWLDQQLSECDPDKTVVITHFAPHKKSIHLRFVATPDDQLISSYYASHSGLIEQHQPALWIHGHTHERQEYSVGKTRVVCNPRGYEGERQQEAFQPNFVVDL